MTKPAFPTLKPRTTLAMNVPVPEGFGPRPFDLAKCEITSDPLPVGRASPDGKYKDAFAKLKPGQCIKVPPDKVSLIQGALRKYIANHLDESKFTVRTIKNYGDGMGRVWLIDGQLKARGKKCQARAN